ncbi:MAG: hypothetical protein ACI8SE_000537 [Bacteroidia bacterium]|jgi:hypothetical protein
MKQLSLLFLCLSLLYSCKPNSDDDVSIEIDCPKAEVLVHNRYVDFEPQYCLIKEYKITGNSLRLSIGISGCNFFREFRFIVDEEKSKSLPPQQNAQMVFVPQNCLTYFEFEICFDISDIERPTTLNLPNVAGVKSIEIN